MSHIFSKCYTILAVFSVVFLSLISISSEAQYGGTVITIGSSSSSGSTSSSTSTSTSGSTTTSGVINNCQSAQVTTNVSGTTLTANLCGIKAGNVININNLSNTDIESLQVTFDQDLNSGVFQIVKISESLTLPNLNGKYITAYELLTTNFNRSIIKNIKFTYKVSKTEADKYTSFNAFTANSPWVGASVSRETDSGSFARFTSTVTPFQQYALTGSSPILTSNTSVRSIDNLNLASNTELIRTGGFTGILATVSMLIILALVSVSLYTTRNKKLNLDLHTKSLFEI